MAAITPTNIQGTGYKPLTATVLGASDTLTYDATKTQILVLYNGTAGALTPTIDGSGASAAIPVKGYGSVDATAGITSPSVGIGAATSIVLEPNEAFMQGIVTITGGDGMTAYLMEL